MMNQIDLYNLWSDLQQEWELIKEELHQAELELISPFKNGVAITGINPPLTLFDKVEILREKLNLVSQKKKLIIEQLRKC